MKKITYGKLFIVTTFLLILISCTFSQQNREILRHADLVMEDHPDSALRILNNVDKPQLTDDADCAYYGMLLTEAQYRCYKPIISESLIDFSIKSLQNIVY